MEKSKHLVSDRIDELRTRKKFPLNVLFELTYNCNLKCAHCYVVKANKKAKELSLNEVRKVLDQLSEAGCLGLVFSGGEILTRSDFFAIAGYARKKNFCLTLFTNGTLIDEQAIDKIAKLHPLRVEISIYGANSSIHDAITQVPGSFERSIKALKLLKESEIRVKIKCSLMKENIAYYKEIISLAEEMGSEYSFDPTITPKSDGSKEPLCLRISNKDLYRLLADPTLNAGAIELEPREQLAEIEPDRFMCKAGVNFCDISAYGDVFPCVQFPIKAGNLRDKSFSEIWENSEVFRQIRSITLTDLYQCRKCSLLRFCSRCPGLAFLEDGDLLGPSQNACNIARIRNQLHTENQRREKMEISYEKIPR